MKIGLVRQRYVPFGGAERYLQGVVSALAGAGHEVHIFAHSWEMDHAVEGVSLHRVPMCTVSSFLRVLSFAINSRPLVERSQCDIVLSLERTLRQDVYRAGDGCHREWLRQRRRYQTVLKRAAWWKSPVHWLLLWLERRVFSPENTQWIIANSQRGREEIIRHYRFPSDRIRVIYNGVDCDRFRPAAKPPGSQSFELLFVGTGFERKGLEFCVRVLSELPPHVTLRVVGKGNTRSYEKLARQLGVAHRVQFSLPSSHILSVYHEADLLLLPTIYEPFANVCLEALAAGLPVVTSRQNGASEVLVPGTNGAAVEEPSDIRALAEAIRPFLDPVHRVARSSAARATAETYSLERNVSQTLKLLRQVAEIKLKPGTHSPQKAAIALPDMEEAAAPFG